MRGNIAEVHEFLNYEDEKLTKLNNTLYVYINSRKENFIYWPQEIKKQNLKILSVKRLSDDKIFKLGDRVRFNKLYSTVWFIDNFHVTKDGSILVRSKDNLYVENVDENLIMSDTKREFVLTDLQENLDLNINEIVFDKTVFTQHNKNGVTYFNTPMNSTIFGNLEQLFANDRVTVNSITRGDGKTFKIMGLVHVPDQLLIGTINKIYLEDGQVYIKLNFNSLFERYNINDPRLEPLAFKATEIKPTRWCVQSNKETDQVIAEWFNRCNNGCVKIDYATDKGWWYISDSKTPTLWKPIDVEVITYEQFLEWFYISPICVKNDVSKSNWITCTEECMEAKDNRFTSTYTCGVDVANGLDYSTISVFKTTIKPPLGLKSATFHKEERLAEIDAAIKRYQDAGFEIPNEWINERNFIIYTLKSRKTYTEILNRRDDK